MMVVIPPLSTSVAVVMILRICIHHHGGDASKKDQGEGQPFHDTCDACHAAETVPWLTLTVSSGRAGADTSL